MVKKIYKFNKIKYKWNKKNKNKIIIKAEIKIKL